MLSEIHTYILPYGMRLRLHSSRIPTRGDLGSHQFFRGRKDGSLVFIRGGFGLFQLASKGLPLLFREGATGIAALLAIDFSPPLTDGRGQEVVKALFASPSMRQILEIGVRRATAQEENLNERLKDAEKRMKASCKKKVQ
jgi:hypothetical protein